MKVEKRQMCRICLVEDVRMYVVTNKDMQDLYEKLTDTPFVTEDSRPMLTCFYCCAKLKQCCQLQRKCVKAEKLFTQMLNEDDEITIKLPTQQGLLEFIISSTDQISIIGERQLDTVDIKEELPDDCDGHNDINEIKDEQQTESGCLDSYPDLKDITSNHSESDSEDDVPLMEIKTEVEEEPVTRKTQSAPTAKKPELYVRLTRLEDTITAQQKETEQPDSPIIRNTKKRTFTAASKSKNSKSINKIVNDTAIATNGLKQKFNCDVCQRGFDFESRLKRHYVIHTGDKPYQCDICQSSFTFEFHLERHYLKHTGVKPYECDICQRSFTFKNSVKVHIRTHTGEKPFKCDICQRSFTMASSLKDHYRTHTGEKPYTCEICQRSFIAACNLKEHYRTHTGEKPFKCKICQRSFSGRSALIVHNRVHTGEKPFKCELCPRAFTSSSRLKKHNRVHTGEKPYKCEICQGSFTTACTLKKHIRIHTGEKPYTCEICQRGFTARSGLKRHNRVHTGEKPYKCEICQKRFAQSMTLKIHNRLHTGEKP